MYKINLNGLIAHSAIDGEKIINLQMLEPSLTEANGEDLEILINTLGGSVDVAFEMYDALSAYRDTYKANITTITDKECASSGVILLLAGNERIVNKNSIPFVHEVYAEVKGGANTLINAGFEVEESNYRIATLYSTRTNLSYEEARWFMSESRDLTPDECFTFGFATKRSEIYNSKQSEKSKLLLKLNYKKEEMTEKESLKEILRKEFAELKNLFTGKVDLKNKKEMTSADVEIDFTEVESDSNPIKGSKAMIDGEPAKGEHLMRSGKTYIFKDGVLDEIIEKKEEEDVEKENLKKEVLNLKNQLSEKDSENKSLKEKLSEESLKVEKFNSLQSKLEVYLKNDKADSKKDEDEQHDFSNTGARLRKVRESRK